MLSVFLLKYIYRPMFRYSHQRYPNYARGYRRQQDPRRLEAWRRFTVEQQIRSVSQGQVDTGCSKKWCGFFSILFSILPPLPGLYVHLYCDNNFAVDWKKLEHPAAYEPVFGSVTSLWSGLSVFGRSGGLSVCRFLGHDFLQRQEITLPCSYFLSFSGGRKRISNAIL